MSDDRIYVSIDLLRVPRKLHLQNFDGPLKERLKAQKIMRQAVIEAVNLTKQKGLFFCLVTDSRHPRKIKQPRYWFSAKVRTP